MKIACVICGNEFDRKVGRGFARVVTCSDECKNKRIHEKRKERYWRNPEKARSKSAFYRKKALSSPEGIERIRENDRRRNGSTKRIEYRKEYGKRYRSSEIGKMKARQAEEKRRGKRAYGDAAREAQRRYHATEKGRDKCLRNCHKRRQMIHSPVSAFDESVSLTELFKRDRGTCQLCGTAVFRMKKGVFNRNDATVDHIVPLSRGGLHKWGNVQLTCRGCNVKKNAKKCGQLRLF